MPNCKTNSKIIDEESQSRINYNELLYMITDTENPSYTSNQIDLRQKTGANPQKEIQSLPDKVLHRVFEKYLKVGKHEQ